MGAISKAAESHRNVSHRCDRGHGALLPVGGGELLSRRDAAPTGVWFASDSWGSNVMILFWNSGCC